MPGMLHEASLADRPLHVLRLLAVPRPVLELDRGVLALARPLDERVPLAAGVRPGNALVLDACFQQRLLDPPAGMALQLHPLIAAAVQLHCHLEPPSAAST